MLYIYQMNKMRFGGWVLAGFLLLAACRKQADPVATPMPLPQDTTQHPHPVVPDSTKGTIQLRFSPVVNGAPLVVGGAWYRNAAGDSFQVTEHKYYVSNFALQTDSGKTISLPETYILVDARNPQTRAVSGIPPGHYTRISFLTGVDSARNVSGAQTGDLEQSKGMFWDWNAGYIMAKMEGKSPQSTRVDSSFYYHIAGFSGKTSVLRTVTLDLPAPLIIKSGSKPVVQLQSEVGSWFSGVAPFRIADQSSVMSIGAQAAAIANNYSKGFSVVRIEP